MATSLKPGSGSERRLCVRVQGAVQGVGFRPFVYRLATERGLTGWVRNDGDGVLAEVQGTYVNDFLDALRNGAPPLARVDRIETSQILVRPDNEFQIVPSGGGPIATEVMPDAAVCDDCLGDLFDSSNRYYRYPFITCTNCGPRYTITCRLPYDRPQTTMAGFPLCAPCAGEYRDPMSRRFHAQPIACPVCGPRLDMPIDGILNLLKGGGVVALKGLGGFHLACDATNESTVSRLRRTKHRVAKPFAVMVANVASARNFAEIAPEETSLLTSPARPVVLIKGKSEVLAPSVAPRLDTLGLMLPSTPIHYLLFHEAAGRPTGTAWLEEPQDLVLIMTSANRSGEPILTDDVEARAALVGVADVVVGHDRPIEVGTDDSVMRMIGGAPAFVRRARGYVPQPIKLGRPVPSILGVGAHLKTTVCVTRGDEAYLSQHIGDMDTAETRYAFDETVRHLLDILEISPERVAHDLHPDFHSTRFAQSFGVPTVPVQHHHAHVASAMAENAMDGPALGLVLDGFGLGPEGESWGGELLAAKGAGFVRVGHLAPLRQPGGDAAARQPWRMAAAVLHRLGRGHEIEGHFCDQPAAAMLGEILTRGVAAPETTSCGRLFDAACGLLRVCPAPSYDGHAPMELESLVRRPTIMPGGWRLTDGVLDLLPVLERLIGCDPVSGAELFHGTLIGALTEWVASAAAGNGIGTVVLAGGCFLNRILAEGLAETLGDRGLRVILPRKVPANDGGLSLGQVWVAAQVDAGENESCA